MQRYALDLKPVSLNKMFIGKKVETPEYRGFQEVGSIELFKQHKKAGTPTKKSKEVHLIFYLTEFKLTDLDNLAKGTCDCLVKAGIIQDDRFIEKLVLKKKQSDTGKDHIEIYVY